MQLLCNNNLICLNEVLMADVARLANIDISLLHYTLNEWKTQKMSVSALKSEQSTFWQVCRSLSRPVRYVLAS